MTTDTCRDIEGLLARAGDGALDAGGRQRLQTHLDACASCRAAVDEQRAAHDLLSALAIADAGPALGFKTRVMAHVADIHADVSQRPSWSEWLDCRRWTWRLAPVALVLVVAAFEVAGQNSSNPTADANAERTSPAAETFSLSSGSDVTVASSLWLDDVTDGDVVSLMLRAGADDSLVDALKETKP